MQHQSSKTTLVDATVFAAHPALDWVGPVLAMGVLVALGANAGWLAAALAGAVFAWDLRPRRRGRRVRLRSKPGSVWIPGAGRFRARDLLGATTCRHETGVRLMLALRRGRPLVIDLPNEEALVQLCRDLGIGHDGFGYVDVPLAPPVGATLRVLTAIAGVVAALGLFVPNADVRQTAASFVGLAVMAWLGCILSMWGNAPAVLRMTSAGVYVPFHGGSTLVPFRDIERVDVTAHALELTVSTPRRPTRHPIVVRTSRVNPHAPNREAMEHAAEQIRAAVDRAHGRYAVKAEPETVAAMLARGAGERLRDWLARVDTIAVGAGGYRATAADEHDLWTLLEDPDAPADVRGAAARLLARAKKDEVRVRVGDVLSTVRDDGARKRIAAIVDDELPPDEDVRRART